MELFKQIRQRRLNPQQRLDHQPGGRPAPTGYYPNNVGHLPIEGTFHAEPGEEPYLPRVQGGKLNGQIDQHPWMYTAATVTAPPQGPRKSGRIDPLEDGPTHEDLRHLKMYQRRMVGTSTTRYQDRPDYGPKQIGRQDGVSYVYWASPDRAMLPYDPQLLDPRTGEMPETWVAIPPAPARGWSARPVYAEQEKINAKAKAVPGHRTPHQDRLANSSYAGQSYSAQTAHVRNPSQQGGGYGGVPASGPGVPGAGL